MLVAGYEIYEENHKAEKKASFLFCGLHFVSSHSITPMNQLAQQQVIIFQHISAKGTTVALQDLRKKRCNHMLALGPQNYLFCAWVMIIYVSLILLLSRIFCAFIFFWLVAKSCSGAQVSLHQYLWPWANSAKEAGLEENMIDTAVASWQVWQLKLSTEDCIPPKNKGIHLLNSLL